MHTRSFRQSGYDFFLFTWGRFFLFLCKQKFLMNPSILLDGSHASDCNKYDDNINSHTQYFDHKGNTCRTCPTHSSITKMSGSNTPELHLEECECEGSNHRKPEGTWQTNDDGTLAEGSTACCELPAHASWKNNTGCEFECNPGYNKDGITCTPCTNGKSDTARWKTGCETCTKPEEAQWKKKTGCEYQVCPELPAHAHFLHENRSVWEEFDMSPEEYQYRYGCKWECDPGYVKNAQNTCDACPEINSNTRWVNNTGCESCVKPDNSSWTHNDIDPIHYNPEYPSQCLFDCDSGYSWKKNLLGRQQPGYKFYTLGMEINNNDTCIKETKEDIQRKEWLEKKAKVMERWNAENPKQPPDEKHHPLEDLLVSAIQFGSGK